MALREVLRWPDARLSQVCAPVGGVTPAISALIADMFDTMYHAQGRGLAAPQLGEMLRLFVMDLTWKEGSPAPQVFIDPELLWRSEDVQPGPEGCLSIPGILTDISRAREIGLSWTDATGRRCEATLSGMAAICAQHEIDHLDGIVTFDRLDPAERAWAEAAYSELTSLT